MTYAVRIRPDAERDLEDAANWYELQRQRLGLEFLDSVEETLGLIQKHPSMFPVVHKNSRRALIHKFPFGVHYVIADETIVVLAVMHGSRDPKRWKSRT